MDWRQILHAEEDLDELDVIRLTDTVPRPRGWSWERWERWQAEGWWEGLWGQLVDSGEFVQCFSCEERSSPVVPCRFESEVDRYIAPSFHLLVSSYPKDQREALVLSTAKRWIFG